MVARPWAPKGRTKNPAVAFGKVYQDDHCVLCGGGGVVHCTFTPDPDKQFRVGGTTSRPLTIAFGCCRPCMEDPTWVDAVAEACFVEFRPEGA